MVLIVRLLVSDRGHRAAYCLFRHKLQRETRESVGSEAGFGVISIGRLNQSDATAKPVSARPLVNRPFKLVESPQPAAPKVASNLGSPVPVGSLI
ncbi:MAG: hypothetical protein DWH81_15885 [Planctomycetota bacterium]|nr:MAG: hypothetical protein DWH81_15885 [Planctomycetota bacterium]